jgi:hypothetical protein
VDCQLPTPTSLTLFSFFSLDLHKVKSLELSFQPIDDLLCSRCMEIYWRYVIPEIQICRSKFRFLEVECGWDSNKVGQTVRADHPSSHLQSMPHAALQPSIILSRRLNYALKRMKRHCPIHLPHTLQVLHTKDDDRPIDYRCDDAGKK